MDMEPAFRSRLNLVFLLGGTQPLRWTGGARLSAAAVPAAIVKRDCAGLRKTGRQTPPVHCFKIM